MKKVKESKQDKMPKRKAYHLQKMEEYTGFHPTEIVLFDDDEKVVWQARKDGYFAVYVAGYQGFDLTKLTCQTQKKPREPMADIKRGTFKEPLSETPPIGV